MEKIESTHSGKQYKIIYYKNNFYKLHKKHGKYSIMKYNNYGKFKLKFDFNETITDFIIYKNILYVAHKNRIYKFFLNGLKLENIKGNIDNIKMLYADNDILCIMSYDSSYNYNSNNNKIFNHITKYDIIKNKIISSTDIQHNLSSCVGYKDYICCKTDNEYINTYVILSISSFKPTHTFIISLTNKIYFYNDIFFRAHKEDFDLSGIEIYKLHGKLIQHENIEHKIIKLLIYLHMREIYNKNLKNLYVSFDLHEYFNNVEYFVCKMNEYKNKMQIYFDNKFFMYNIINDNLVIYDNQLYANYFNIQYNNSSIRHSKKKYNVYVNNVPRFYNGVKLITSYDADEFYIEHIKEYNVQNIKIMITKDNVNILKGENKIIFDILCKILNKYYLSELIYKIYNLL